MKASELIIKTNRLNSLKTNHILHLIMSVITWGVWIPVWIIISIGVNSERKMVEREISAIED